MKLIIFVLFAFLVIVASTPIDKTKINPNFGKCNVCQDDSNKPLCAVGDTDKLKLSFLNECALKKYNCEKGTKLTKKSDGQCPGTTGIRLS